MTSTGTNHKTEAELFPGYYIEDATGAWLTLPWPDDLSKLPPSLGPGICAWARENLVHPQTGEPWEYTLGQRKFLHLWYAYDEKGRFIYRSGAKRGAKGTGKDPFGATICLAELFGPVELDRKTGRGTKRKLALVQIASNSEAQSRDMLRVAGAMLPNRTRDRHGIEVGKVQIQMDSGSRIELLTNSEASSEGDPATAIILNESHHMTESSGGHALAAVARRNVAKSPIYIAARLLELTNAHRQGMDSEAERTYDAWQAQVSGKTKKQDILYDSREAPPNVDLTSDEGVMRGLRAAYGDAPWSDLERLRDEIWDTRTSLADTIRFYMNGLAAAEDSWIDPQRYDDLVKADETVRPGEQITMFLDCSKTEDVTGLVACRVSDGHVFVLGSWQAPHGKLGKGWSVPRHEVDAAVMAADADYDVVWFGVDPSPAVDDDGETQYWGPLVDEWHRHFRRKLKVWATPGALGSSVCFDMRLSQLGGAGRNKAFTEAAMQLMADIDEHGDFSHDGNTMMRQHFHNARRRPNKWGVTLGKVNRSSKKKVDLAVCAVGARMGRRLMLNSGKLRKPFTGDFIAV